MRMQRTVQVANGVLLALLAATPLRAEEPGGEGQVSYYHQVRPIFQANCHGCHQPAKASGKYVMTSLDRLVAGGESETPAIVAGQPEESHLLELITADDGKAEMPKGKPPLAAADVALVRRWIEAGAIDDTPPAAVQRYDQEHPPVYHRPPVITSLDYSPDGSLLAVSGFHEVLLIDAATRQLAGRLVGMSDRIESVRFSPDGTRLAVTGGLPGRVGELQVWQVAERKLLLSVPVTFDTVYGGSWSPDGRLIALGGADRSVRAIESDTGREVVYMAAHDDWVRDTVFSGDGQSIFSVSRDMTVKMTDVATQRFVGNVTTHTPGVLRGGMHAVARHPSRTELLVGGADGAPKLFQMDVKAAPSSGGNPNQIREYAALPGRVFAVRFAPDGGRFYAGSSLDGAGEVRSFETDTGKELWRAAIAESGTFALACAPDGKTLAAGGTDGTIRLVDPVGGKLLATFLPVTLAEHSVAAQAPIPAPADTPPDTDVTPVAPATVAQIVAVPESIRITTPSDYAQLLLTATLTDGTEVDVTRQAAWSVAGDVGAVSPSGLFAPRQDGQGQVVALVGGQRAEIPVTVTGIEADDHVDFIRDVNPVLARLGCNAGTCHGAAKGKNGFKLSLRGYNALEDIRALTDDLAGRRTSVASPEDSLMLLKPTGVVPHEGGQLIRPGDRSYEIIRRWLAAGARLELESPRVARISVLPTDPVVQRPGERRQLRVVATYTDGTTRDVTREAFIESGNTEVATADGQAGITAVRRGEAPVLVRYEGAYAATTLSVMGDRSGFVWEAPETWGRIDELVAAKWQRMKILPSPLCTDAEFIRRVFLDLTGLPPSPDQVRALLDDPRPTRAKRDALIDQLIGSDEFVDYWTNKWADLLQVNGKFLAPEGAQTFHQWIRQQVAANTPYDQLARSIITASGSNRENPAASYFKVLRDPLSTMENTTHLFLAIRFNCNKCHDHPFERWTQDQYYQTAAYFAQFGLDPDPAAGDKKIGGTAVEGAKPLYEIVADKGAGEVTHDRTGQVAAPQFPYDCKFEAPAHATRRQLLAAWLTSPDNPYFARSYVNRFWGYFLGVGIIEPIDDTRAGNPPSNPALLEHLTREFIQSGFDGRHVMRRICQSRTYQLSVETNRWNEDDTINYAHATARRLPAEVLYDAIYRVTGAASKIPGVAPGTRAAALPDAQITLPDGFLANLGRPARESACECERSSGLQLGPVMALVSGPTVGSAIADTQNELTRLVAAQPDDALLVGELFLRILNRPASDAEIATALGELHRLPAEHAQLVARLGELEAALAPSLAAAEQQRQEAITAARDELAAYETQLAARQAELEKQQQEQIAQAEAALAELERQLPERIAQWEAKLADGSRHGWTSLDPIELSASNGAQLARQEDLSVFVSGPAGKGTYKFVARTERSAITALKLEALADERLPGKGPGRAENGNFVVTELRVEWAPEGEPDKTGAVKLQNAQADFSQNGYAIASAIDGQKAPAGNGWAVVPATGKDHVAVLETAQDLAAGPGLLTVWLDQEFQDGQHALGRFRLAVTAAPRPVKLDDRLPQEIADLLAVPAEQRNEGQRDQLLKYYRGVDTELVARTQALAEARKPLPPDARRVQLRQELAQAEQPLPTDPKLAELRHDVELSAEQLAAARLTFTQDLAWALINSPAFLFNR